MPLLLVVTGVLAFGGFTNHPAHGATSGNLVPTEESGSSNYWSANTGDKVQAVNEGSCSSNDSDWITGPYGSSNTFRAPYPYPQRSTIIKSIELFVCYGANTAGDGFEALTVYLGSYALADKSNAFDLNPHGVVAPVLASKKWDFPGTTPSLDEYQVFGVTDHGFLALSRTRVYAIWAVVTYELPPPITVSLEDVGFQGSVSPYAAGQKFIALINLSLNGTVNAMDLVMTWDHTVVSFVTVSQSFYYDKCMSTTTDFHCTFKPYALGDSSTPIQLQVISPTACTVSMTVTLSDHGSGATLATASDSAALNGGCPSPTTAPSPTPTSMSSVSPTSTVPSPSATATATGTLAPSATIPVAPTSTPTSAGSTTPVPTSTPTPSATVPPGVNLKFRLRGISLASDGSH